jgi:hypothetical protein
MLQNILKSVVPGLATAVGGPLAGIAIQAIADKLGVDPSEDAVVKHLTSNPEHVIKLKEIDVEKLRLLHANTADARAMNVAAMSSKDWFVSHFNPMLATYWSVVATTYIGFITFANIPENNIRFADTVLGFILGTVVATLINFYFGTADKDNK